MNSKETFAMQPEAGSGKPIDLLRLGPAVSKSIDSSCTLKFDRQYVTGADGNKTASFINITADAKQFKDASAAQEAFTDTKKQTTGAKPLPGFADSGFYIAPVTTQQSAVQYALHTVHYKNILVTYTVPLEENDKHGERSAAQLSKVTVDLIKRIDNGKGRQPVDYSASVRYKGHPLIDSCHAINYSLLQKALQRGIEFNSLSFNTNTALAEDDDNGMVPAHISSACRAFFRTAADAKEQAAHLKPEANSSLRLAAGESYTVRYPHALIVQTITSEDANAAKTLISYYKHQSEKHAKSQPDDGMQIHDDDALGDQAVHVTTNPSASEATSSTDIYYIAKDQNIFIVTASFARQTKPYPIGAQSISHKSAQLMLDALLKGAQHAERKAQ